MDAADLLRTLDGFGYDVLRTLVSVLWQSSILLVAVGLLAWALRRHRPSVRHVLLAGAVLAIPMIPLLGSLASRAAPPAEIRVMPRYSAPSDWKQPAKSLTALPPVAADTTRQAPTAPAGRGDPEALDEPTASGAELVADQTQRPAPSWKSLSILSYPWALVFLGYAAGAAVFLTLVAGGRACLARWVRRGRVVTDSRTLRIFRAAARQLGLDRDVVVVESPQAYSPMTIGTMNPVVLLPCDITREVSDQELFSIAVHELTHVKRLDSLWLTLLSLVRAVLFFHPLVWLACRQISLLADSACDDTVLDATGEPVSYAKMLAHLAEDLPRRAWMTELASGIMLSESAFLRRIKAILSNRRGQSRKLSRIAMAITVLLATASLALALMLPVATRADRNDKSAKGIADTGPKYLSPTAMVADRADKTIYIAEATAGQIAVFDIATGKVTGTIAIDMPVSGVALAPDGTSLYVTTGSAEGRLCVVDVKTAKVTARIRVGHTPVSPVVSPDGKTVYVCNRFNNTVGVVDVAAGKQVATIVTPRQPISADISKDGASLIVANHLPAGPADRDDAAAVSIIDTAARKIAKVVKLPPGSTGLRRVAVSPDGKYACVTHTIARYQLPTTQLDRGWTSCNNLTVIDVRTGKFIATVPLDDINRGVANPWALAWTADGRNLCVSQAGSHDVTVIDFPALIAKLNRVAAARKPPPVNHVYNDLGFLEGLSVRLDLRGKGPRCMAMVGWHAYIGEYFSDSLTVLDINAIGTPLGPIVKVVPLGPKQEITAVRKGEMLFNDGKRCFQSWLSCATCHPDGRADGFRWDLLNDGLQNPKKTKSLVGAHKTAPSMVTGVRPSAEAAVRARIRTGLFATWPEADAAAVDAYLKSLKPIRSPYLVGGNLSASARRGKGLFAQARCASCHKGPYLTDMKKYDLGTGERINRNVKFDTPTLREVWRTAPYLHHGRAVSIMGVLTKFNPGDKHGVTSKLTKKQLADLAAYVLSL